VNVNGSLGFSGDGKKAVSARTKGPQDLAFGPDGSYYVIDHGNQRVRKVNTSGIISSVAGNGFGYYGGDGGLATNAEISSARAVAADATGNLYIADTANNRIRKIDTSGIITTVAGTGKAGYSGDGSQATLARVRSPLDLSVDPAGDLFLADTSNNRIRKVDTFGIITTV